MNSSGDFLSFHAANQPKRIAAIDPMQGRRWTYSTLDRDVSRFAAMLASFGLVENDRVVCVAKNCMSALMLHFACARIGAIFVPLNWRLAALEIDALIADAEPSLITGDDNLQRISRSGKTLDELTSIASGCDPVPETRRDPDRPCLILYTSGTSGQPKGVVLSLTNLIETAINFSLLGRVSHASRFLCDSPMFHVIGMVSTVWPAIMRGGSLVMSDGFNPARTLARLSDPELAITHYFCVPQMAASLRAEAGFDPAGLRHLTGLFTGGAPHPAASILRWLDDGVAVADGFGMTETGTVFGMSLEPDIIRERAGSVGIATPRVMARIVDDNGATLGAGYAGELQLKGRNIFREYWRKPQESRDAFTGDGWFRTGDIARADEAGFHWIVDRKKDMYISGGENVYPVEIESVLAKNENIAECAVVGVPDDRWGEVGHLYLVPSKGCTLDPQRILSDLAGSLAKYKVPKHVSMIDALPRNGAGKVLKNVLGSESGSSRNEVE
jgi:fatty-acyl-CoA synthase